MSSVVDWRLIMRSVKRRYSKEQFIKRGDLIYQNEVRPHLKPGDRGKFVAIDIETAAYELDADELKAGDRLRTYTRRADLDGAGRVSRGPSYRRTRTTGSLMITGVVIADEARVPLKVSGSNGRQHKVEAIVDTGYTGSLILPPRVVQILRLAWRSMDRFTLANGSECVLDVYVATVEWGGKLRTILVDQADTEPLVGMRLLRDHELKMQLRDNGKVTIKRLPSRQR